MSKRNTYKSKTRHRNRGAAQSTDSYRLKFLRPAVFILAIAGLVFGAVALLGSKPPAVLAYATNINHSGLLASTNQQRAANGMPAFTLDGRLNSAAQAKANDMVANDYWAHLSPDGRQPWDFIIAAGYSYNSAGENLAYGALTSDQTVQAWMNSPGHRANILKDNFTQVGFGFANSGNYQGGGPQTVVVAMYASPYGAPAPAPPPPAPAPIEPAPTAPSPVPFSAPASPVSSNTNPPQAPSAADNSAAAPPESEIKQEDASSKDEEGKTGVAPTQIDKGGRGTVTPVEQTQTVRRISLVTGNYTPWMAAGVLLVGVVALGVFLYRHSKAWHRLIVRGENFIIHHPVVDVVAITVIVAVTVLLQSVGRVL